AGMLVQIEPRPERRRTADARRSDLRRPDIRLQGFYGVFLVDVTITHPSADSYVVSASRYHLYAADRRDTAKMNKYRDLAAAEHAEFIPCALESYGAFGHGAERLLTVIARESQHFNQQSAAAFRSDATRRVAVALQVGN